MGAYQGDRARDEPAAESAAAFLVRPKEPARPGFELPPLPDALGGEALAEKELELRELGVYVGSKGPGEFTLWDAGGWQILGEGRVRISTATDAEVAYRFSLSGDRLAFEDAAGCRYEYRRAW